MRNYMKKMTMMGVMAITMLFGFTAPVVAQEYVYELTNELTDGGQYLIVNTQSKEDGYALGYDETGFLFWEWAEIKNDKVTVKSNPDVDATSVWTVAKSGNNWNFTNSNYNSNYHLHVTSPGLGSPSLQVSESSTDWTWDETNKRLYCYKKSNNRYLRYNNNNFEISTNRSSIYLYKKVLKKVIFSVEPLQLTFNCDLSQSANNPITVNGSQLRGNVSVDFIDNPNSAFSVSSTSINKSSSNTINNATVTVTFNPNKTLGVGTYTGKVKLSTPGIDPIEVTLTGTINKPEVSATESSLSFNCDLSQSVSQTFNVSGAHLDGNVSVTLTDDNGVFSVSPTSFAKTSENTASGTVTVTFNPTALGTYDYSGSITLSSKDATPVVVPLTGTVNVPEVAADKDEMKDFWQAPNYEHTQSFKLTASNISDNVIIEVSNGSLFKVSADGTNFANSVTVSAADAKADDERLYIFSLNQQLMAKISKERFQSNAIITNLPKSHCQADLMAKTCLFPQRAIRHIITTSHL